MERVKAMKKWGSMAGLLLEGSQQVTERVHAKTVNLPE
jgi:hypothetical protein